MQATFISREDIVIVPGVPVMGRASELSPKNLEQGLTLLTLWQM